MFSSPNQNKIPHYRNCPTAGVDAVQHGRQRYEVVWCACRREKRALAGFGAECPSVFPWVSIPSGLQGHRIRVLARVLALAAAGSGIISRGPQGRNGDSARNGSQRQTLNTSFSRDVHFRILPLFVGISTPFREQSETIYHAEGASRRAGQASQPTKKLGSSGGAGGHAPNAFRHPDPVRPGLPFTCAARLAVSRCIPPSQSEPRASTPAVKLVSVPSHEHGQPQKYPSCAITCELHPLSHALQLQTDKVPFTDRLRSEPEGLDWLRLSPRNVRNAVRSIRKLG